MEMPKTVHTNRPNTTHSPKQGPNTALMLAIWQILFLNLGVLIKKLMVSKYIICS